MTHPALDPYAVLGVARDASAAQISSAYRARLRRLHPDTRDIGSDAGADAALQQTLAAYVVLSDPRTRARYDRRHRDPGGPRPVPIPVRVVAAPAQPHREPLIQAGPVRWRRDARSALGSDPVSYQDVVMILLRRTRS